MQFVRKLYIVRTMCLGITVKSANNISNSSCDTSHKICENTSFHWSTFSCIRKESTILSLYEKIQVTENPHSCMFYAVMDVNIDISGSKGNTCCNNNCKISGCNIANGNSCKYYSNANPSTLSYLILWKYISADAMWQMTTIKRFNMVCFF